MGKFQKQYGVSFFIFVFHANLFKNNYFFTCDVQLEIK